MSTNNKRKWTVDSSIDPLMHERHQQFIKKRRIKQEKQLKRKLEELNISDKNDHKIKQQKTHPSSMFTSCGNASGDDNESYITRPQHLRFNVPNYIN